MKVWQGVKDRVNSIFSNLPFYFYNIYFIITLLFIFILTFYPILYLKLCNLSLRHYSILNKRLQKLKLKNLFHYIPPGLGAALAELTDTFWYLYEGEVDALNVEQKLVLIRDRAHVGRVEQLLQVQAGLVAVVGVA